MSQKQIKKQCNAINFYISKWEKALVDLQNNCLHPNALKSHGSNTGNYDPSADCYWTDYHCLDCGKKMV